jgi:hypothetical protein
MHISLSLESEPPIAGDGWVWTLRPAPVEDPIPNPEPEVPSLGYPDLGVFHHSPRLSTGHFEYGTGGAKSTRIHSTKGCRLPLWEH